MDHRTTIATLLACGLSLTWAAGAAAQSATALDTLARPTERADSGTALARRQIAAGQLTLALSTLERTILARPNDGAARLLHASVLCRLDDASGSLVEFDRLRGWDFPPELWREATEPCEARGAGR